MPVKNSLGFERLYRIRLHVTQLNRVADLLRRIHGVRHQVAGFVERVLANQAHVDQFARGQVVEQQVHTTARNGRNFFTITTAAATTSTATTSAASACR